MTFRFALACCLLALLLTAHPGSCADKALPYRNKEFGFTLQQPAAWTIAPASADNIRVRLVAPANTPPAECAVVVKRFPKAVSAKQAEIDQIFAESPTTAELEEVLSQGGHNVRVFNASSGKLHNRPAHVARVQYKISRDAYASGQVLMTATPGLTWTLSCSGLGDTPAHADKSYQHWENTIKNLIGSFVFK